MARKLLIDAAHKEETRVVVVAGDRVEEFDFETSSKKQIVGNIYLARIARVESALQAVFVEYGGNRHGFLAFSEIHPDYYHVPVSERESREGELASGAADGNADGQDAESPASANASASQDAIAGMDVIDPSPGDASDEPEEAPADPQGAEGPVDDSEFPEAADAPRPPTPESDQSAKQKLGRKFRVQEVMRARQILLVQVVKDERGSKGAALTTYISLAGRYCVLMPNATRGGGISRKITSSADRKKLESISGDFKIPKGAGLIIRTAGAKRTKQEIRRDYDYLLRQWDHIRELALTSYAPAPIYEEGGLIQRAVRDIYTKDIESIEVQGKEGYRFAKDFMKLLMPSHAKKVRNYSEKVPLFVQHGVEPFLADLYSPVAQLPSGGYIVINSTEALTAIDVNSGKAIKHGTLEQTALETNMEAAAEVARQLRLRDLAGLIVIDFIDMEERQNNAAVEKHFKEMIKGDRAKVQVGRISSFGLLEMSRQRLRPGIAEMTSTTCAACSGTGLVRSVESLSLTLLRQIESESTRASGGEIVARVPVQVANFIVNRKRDSLDQIENTYGVSLLIEAVPNAAGTELLTRRQKTGNPRDSETAEQVVSIETSLQSASAPDASEADGFQKQQPSAKRKRRRGGRKRSRSGTDNIEASQADRPQEAAAEPGDLPKADEASETQDSETKAKKPRASNRSRRSGRKGRSPAPSMQATAGNASETQAESDPDMGTRTGDDIRGDGATQINAADNASETAPAVPTEAEAAQSEPGPARTKQDDRRPSRGRRGRSNGTRNRENQQSAAESEQPTVAADIAGGSPSAPASIHVHPPAPPPQPATPDSPSGMSVVSDADPVAAPAETAARTGWWSA